MGKTEPRTLPGFMELLPSEQILFDDMKQKIEKSYQKFGFLPIDTPIIEYAEVLLAKAGGETEKQIYRFEKGDTDLALRFDLTVPLAKYVAKNYGNLSFPFRRYQIGKVYRGEKAQKGRYREFYQCDIDIIGDETLDIINDAELPAVIYSTFRTLGFENFTIKINNRKILNGLFEGIGQKDKSVEILRIIDKIDKIGEQAVRKEIAELGVGEKIVNTIIDFIRIDGSADEKIEKLEKMDLYSANIVENESQNTDVGADNMTNATFTRGVNELKEVVENIRLFGVPDKNFTVDLTIARGLDYYTGTVYETFLNDYREIGSVCSGGRYENLAENYTDKKLPGVGVSIDLTRLFYKLNELNLIKADKKSISDVLIIPMTENKKAPLELATSLRNLGINTEIYLNNKKIKAKMKKLILMLMLFMPMATFAQKFGHVNAQEVMASMPEFIKARGEVEAQAKQYDNDLKAMQEEMQRKYEDYEKNKSTMNETKRKETEDSLSQMYQKIQQSAQDNQQALGKLQQDKIGPITNKLVEAIKAVGKAGGYVYIMDTTSGIPYISETLSKDVTAEVKAELNKTK